MADTVQNLLGPPPPAAGAGAPDTVTGLLGPPPGSASPEPDTGLRGTIKGNIKGTLEDVPRTALSFYAGMLETPSDLVRLATLGHESIPAIDHAADAIRSFRDRVTTAPRTTMGRWLENAQDFAAGASIPIPGVDIAKGAAPVVESASKALVRGMDATSKEGMEQLGNFFKAIAEHPPEDEVTSATRADLRGVAANRGFRILPHEDPAGSWVRHAAEKVNPKGAVVEASRHNQPLVDSMAARSLGLRDDVELTEGRIRGVIQSANSVYQQVRGAIAAPFARDTKMIQETDALGDAISRTEKELPELYSHTAEEGVQSKVTKEIARLKSLLSHANYTANATVDAINKLRDEARADFDAESLDKAVLGPLRNRAAEVLEGRLNRALTEAGRTDLAGQLQSARELIARANDVLYSFAGGHIDARKLAFMLGKGKPLGGGLKTLAVLARTFPRSFTPVLKTGVDSAHSWLRIGLALDVMYEGLHGLAHGAPIYAAIEAAPKVAVGAPIAAADIARTAGVAGHAALGRQAASGTTPAPESPQ